MRKGYRQIKQQIGIGILGGTAGVIGNAMPGTTGTALTNTSSSLASWAGPIATVTGAGMTMRSLDMLPKSRRKK